MRKSVFCLFLVLCLLPVSCSMRAYREIRVTSARLVSVAPDGLSALNALVEIGVDNPAGNVTVSDLDVMARFRGQDAMVFTADPVTLEGRTERLYELPLQGRLADGFNPFQLLSLLGGNFSYEDLSFSLRCRATLPNGLGKNIELKDMPLSQLMEQLEHYEQKE